MVAAPLSMHLGRGRFLRRRRKPPARAEVLEVRLAWISIAVNGVLELEVSFLLHVLFSFLLMLNSQGSGLDDVLYFSSREATDQLSPTPPPVSRNRVITPLL